ncbi:MAG: sigma 54-interacting transcriptional regulator [Thermodesulfobacteriota bacterium]|nr:sigma 54-interacting transcriptional regulator [Thermodesulfobacteriota bacterium]
MKKILIVDDSKSIRESLRIIFQDSLSLIADMKKLKLITAGFKEDIFSLTEKEKLDLIIWEANEPWKQKLDILQRLVNDNKGVALLFMGEHHVLKEFQKIFDYDIIDFIKKPFNVYEIRQKVKTLLLQKDLPSSFSRSSFEREKRDKYLGIPYSSIFGEKAAPIITRAINTNIPVLIKGEKGTGKNFLAKFIHYHQGLMHDSGFITVDCKHLTEESWAKITRKTKDSSRPYSSATLFLEEIGELRPEFQTDLMEILDEKMIFLPGDRGPDLNFRIIASTTSDLLKKVNDGKFRQDLFYKLHVMPIYLFPLREKREEIPLLVDQIIAQYSLILKMEKKEFSSGAMKALQSYLWPGNIRELECVVTRSSIFSEKQIISKEDILWAIEEKDLVLSDKEVPEGILSSAKEMNIVEGKAQVNSIYKDNNISFEVLLASLAHEIKNPLVAIKTFTQLLEGKFNDPEFRGQFYRIVGENIDRLNSFTEDILQYHHFTIALPDFNPVDLDSIIEIVLKEDEDKLKSCGVKVERNFAHELPKIITDKERLFFALRNIISSIIKMTDDGGILRFSVDIENFEKDNGPLINFGVSKGKAANIKIAYLNLINAKDGTIKIDIPSSPPDNHVLDLDILMAKNIIDNNMGVMRIENTEAKEIVITIKLPIKFEE